MENTKLSYILGLLKEANDFGMKLSFEDGEVLIKVNKGVIPSPQFIERLRNEKQSIIEYFESNNEQIHEGNIFKIRPVVTVAYMDKEYFDVSATQQYWINPEIDSEYKAMDNVHGKVTVGYDIKGKLDVNGLINALLLILEFHESLRFTFHEVNGTYKCRLEDQQEKHFKPIYIDKTKTEYSPRQDSCDIISVERNCFKAILEKNDEDAYVLTLLISHAVIDSWGVNMLLNDLFITYHTYTKHNKVYLKKPEYQLKDYIYSRNLYEREKYYEHKQHWKHRFKDLPAQPKLFGKSGMGKPVDEKVLRIETVKLCPESYQNILSLAACNQCSLFHVLNAVFRKFIFKVTGNADFIIGTYVSGRDYPGTEKLLGCFAQTKILRVGIQEEDSIAEIIKKVDIHESENALFDACSLKEVMAELLAPGFPLGAAFWNINMQFEDLSANHAGDRANTSQMLADTGLTLIKHPFPLNQLIAIDATFLFVMSQHQMIVECQFDGSTYSDSEMKYFLASFNQFMTMDNCL